MASVLTQCPPARPSHGAAVAAIEVQAASKRYGAVRALDAVSLEIRQGEFFGLLGPWRGQDTLIQPAGGVGARRQRHAAA